MREREMSTGRPALNEGVGEHVRTRFQPGCKDAKALEALAPLNPPKLRTLGTRTERRKLHFFCRTGFRKDRSVRTYDPAVDLMSRRHPLRLQEPLFQNLL